MIDLSFFLKVNLKIKLFGFYFNLNNALSQEFIRICCSAMFSKGYIYFSDGAVADGRGNNRAFVLSQHCSWSCRGRHRGGGGGR